MTDSSTITSWAPGLWPRRHSARRHRPHWRSPPGHRPRGSGTKKGGTGSSFLYPYPVNE